MKTCRSKRPKACSTVHQSRIDLFAASMRPVERIAYQTKTPWGRATITGRLWQRHRDLLDALDEATVQKVVTPDRCQHRLVDPHKLRTLIGRKNKRAKAETVDDLMTDLVGAELQIDTNTGLHVVGHIFDEVRWHDNAAPGAASRLGKDKRRLYRVKISAAWREFIESDLKFFYDRNLMGALRHGVSQAVARLLLTHTGHTRVEIDKALGQVGIEPGERQPLWDARRRLAADQEGLLALGIVLAEGMIIVRRGDRSTGTESPTAGTESPAL